MKKFIDFQKKETNKYIHKQNNNNINSIIK